MEKDEVQLPLVPTGMSNFHNWKQWKRYLTIPKLSLYIKEKWKCIATRKKKGPPFTLFNDVNFLCISIERRILLNTVNFLLRTHHDQNNTRKNNFHQNWADKWFDHSSKNINFSKIRFFKNFSYDNTKNVKRKID